MRKGLNEFTQIPNNTLVEGDIIKLKPGDTIPVLADFLDYDLVWETEKDENDRDKRVLKKVPHDYEQ